MAKIAVNYYGIIHYTHTEIDHTERVPFMNQKDMHESIANALDNGFQTSNINCYVQNEEAANAIFAIMDERKINRCRIFQLTENNLQKVLGDFTVAIPATA